MKIGDVPPSAKDFVEFRAACGWGLIDIPTAKTALKGSLFVRAIHVDGALVGFGRVVGDGVLNFYIQDLIVSKKYRNHGYGKEIMTALMDDIYEMAKPGATIGLMAAREKEHFYKAFGFVGRPNEEFGAGMIKVLSTP